jgi:hypothetical protein
VQQRGSTVRDSKGSGNLIGVTHSHADLRGNAGSRLQQVAATALQQQQKSRVNHHQQQQKQREQDKKEIERPNSPEKQPERVRNQQNEANLQRQGGWRKEAARFNPKQHVTTTCEQCMLGVRRRVGCPVPTAIPT